MAEQISDRFALLDEWLCRNLGAVGVSIDKMAKLSGGAIQENWLLDLTFDGGQREGEQSWVLRTNAPSTISTSLGRPEEFAILKCAHQAGVTVPEPILLCEDATIIGQPFYVMTRAGGTAQGRKIARDPNLATFGPALAEQLGVELARLHRVTPQQSSLPFLPVPGVHPAQYRIDRYRADLDALPDGHPVLEYALNWLEQNLPPANGLVLTHTDFRTGNYMVEDGNLTAILDWEFASWSDPDEDIGWLCARCWRFGNDDLRVGGIAHVEDLLRGYEPISNRKVDTASIPYWQVMAELRWAVIALQQGERCRSGTEVSQELALTGLMASEMELNILNLIDGLERRVA
ncbi:phosphotransferase family protein [Roseovarius pacificus]|uniref:phosphotransferase family protein n=1 Tax=Roseovarius pacificus TaxID=337701 RepID=UPI002A189FDF|nr:phosphotransferase family protein [Roseovarius pacificus]